jgi:hypothetical protein
MPKKKNEFEKIHMTNAQIKEVKERIASAERMLNDPRDWVRNKITDPELIKANIKKDQKLLNEHAPRKLRGQRANKMYAEAKELAQKIRDQMPSNRQYFQQYPKDSDGHNRQAEFEKVVAQQMKFQSDPKIIKMVTRYKNIMRRIDPSDPTISNIEALRK